MNILITNISAFPYNVTEFEYEVRIDNCEVEKIKAKHTNESILKCLTHLGDVKKNGGINKIIAWFRKRLLMIEMKDLIIVLHLSISKMWLLHLLVICRKL